MPVLTCLLLTIIFYFVCEFGDILDRASLFHECALHSVHFHIFIAENLCVSASVKYSRYSPGGQW